MPFKIALSVCLIVLLPLAAAAQSAQDTVPRTAWGAPDLQGIYDFGTATPFQRPAELAGRTTFTAEEAAVQEQINAAQFAEGLNTENLTPPNYNNFWFDNGSGVLPTQQSSLVVDPPDGRLPAFTEQQERRFEAGTRRGRTSGADALRRDRRRRSGRPRARRALPARLQLGSRRSCRAPTTTTCSCSRPRTTW